MRFYLLSTLIFFFSLLTGCASSDVSREAASNVDMGVQNANNLVNNASSSSFTETYQNSSQTAKCAVLGGAAGDVAALENAASVAHLRHHQTRRVRLGAGLHGEPRASRPPAAHAADPARRACGFRLSRQRPSQG